MKFPQIYTYMLLIGFVNIAFHKTFFFLRFPTINYPRMFSLQYLIQQQLDILRWVTISFYSRNLHFKFHCYLQELYMFLFQNMSSIPSPTIMQLDPNDENIILSIPEDSGPLAKDSALTLTPKKVFNEKYKLVLSLLLLF